jgi:hypothetical protein
VRPDNAIVIDADGNGLRIAKAICGRVTASTSVVIVQACDCVKPEQASEIRQLIIDMVTDPSL